MASFGGVLMLLGLDAGAVGAPVVITTSELIESIGRAGFSLPFPPQAVSLVQGEASSSGTLFDHLLGAVPRAVLVQAVGTTHSPAPTWDRAASTSTQIRLIADAGDVAFRAWCML